MCVLSPCLGNAESDESQKKKMCLRLCVVLHALCGVFYTGAGSVLMVAGIFFFISSPFLQLGSNMLTGGLCIVFGVCTVIITCCGGKEMDSPRLDKLMSCTLFILAACVANIVILECWEWWLHSTEELLSDIELQELAFYGHIIPSVTTCAVIALAFLDAQFLYCTNSLRKTPQMRHIHINETVSDIEYIIPRHKSRPLSSKQAQAQAQAQSLAQYTQSWVFDTEGSSQADSPYLKLSDARKQNPSSPIVSVQVDSGSEENSDAGRQLMDMKSFSRNRIQYDDISEQSSSASITQPTAAPIYECLEKLTQPSVYKSHLDSYQTERLPSGARIGYPKSVGNSMKTHDTLMAELGRSIGHKQAAAVAIRSPGSDADFSKELEAALKLIQDLESPNTIETPPGDSCAGSSKTLSAHSSFDGKQTRQLPVESQSTSGYNSPSLSGRETPAVSCVVRQIGPKSVISVFSSAPNSPAVARQSVANAKPVDGYLRNVLGRVRGLLSSRRPSLLPDLERAVLKSESLAFLSDCELEDRLQATREVHRRIEEKVKRDMSLRKWESCGSIENMMDYKKIEKF